MTWEWKEFQDIVYYGIIVNGGDNNDIVMMLSQPR